MSELLMQAKQLLSDEVRLGQIIRDTQIAIAHKGKAIDDSSKNFPADGIRQCILTCLNDLIAAEESPALLPCPLRCLRNARSAYRERNGSFLEMSAKMLMDNIATTGTVFPEDFSIGNDKKRIDYLGVLRDRSYFKYTRKSRLNAVKQDILFWTGLMDDLFMQLDDVLLQDYRPKKFFCGRGGFGIVSLVEDKNGRSVVLKKIPLDNDIGMTELKNIVRQRRMGNEYTYVVKIFDIGVDVDYSDHSSSMGLAFYTMEAADDLNALCPDEYGWYQPFTLDYLLQKKEEFFVARRTEFLVYAFFQMIIGIGELHAAGLIHRDLKPANIAVFNGKIKIIDLGLISGKEDPVVAGTRFFSPDDLFMQKRAQTQNDDIYALGKLFYTLVTFLPPEKYPSFPDNWPDEEKFYRSTKKMIQRACATSPDERFSSAQDFMLFYIDEFFKSPSPP